MSEVRVTWGHLSITHRASGETKSGPNIPLQHKVMNERCLSILNITLHRYSSNALNTCHTWQTGKNQGKNNT